MNFAVALSPLIQESPFSSCRQLSGQQLSRGVEKFRDARTWFASKKLETSILLTTATCFETLADFFIAAHKQYPGVGVLKTASMWTAGRLYTLDLSNTFDWWVGKDSRKSLQHTISKVFVDARQALTGAQIAFTYFGINLSLYAGAVGMIPTLKLASHGLRLVGELFNIWHCLKVISNPALFDMKTKEYLNRLEAGVHTNDGVTSEKVEKIALGQLQSKLTQYEAEFKDSNTSNDRRQELDPVIERIKDGIATNHSVQDITVWISKESIRNEIGKCNVAIADTRRQAMIALGNSVNKIALSLLILADLSTGSTVSICGYSLTYLGAFFAVCAQTYSTYFFAKRQLEMKKTPPAALGADSD
ncbi:MAG: hypothetical protein H0X51_03955 [Parachlamydiaceae bacterium]|nr:hypothetical protein [Parachlamydiaceae bacterium]